MVRYNILFLCLLCVFLCACQNKRQTTDYPILKASLEKAEVSMNDLFSKVEVLPLETNDSCLMVFPWKILHWEGYYAVFDFSVFTAFVFDENGKYSHRIGRRGQGPGEYTFAYDIQRDEDTGNFYMVTPFSEMFTYAPDGSFLKKALLPSKPNYFSFENYGKYWITWSLPSFNDEPGVCFISKETAQCDFGWWTCNRAVNAMTMFVFHKYKGDVYFGRPLNRNVYRLTGKDSLQVAYAWDFGPDNYSVEQWGFSEKAYADPNEASLADQYVADHTIPYYLAK